jgi:hypothetical protein
VGSGVGSGVAVGFGVGLAVGFAVGFGGLGVGLAVGLGVAFTPHVLEDDALFVGPEPAEGIVSKPVGRTPGSVNSLAAMARMRFILGTWMLPRSSYAPLTYGRPITIRNVSLRPTALAMSIQSAM